MRHAPGSRRARHRAERLRFGAGINGSWLAALPRFGAGGDAAGGGVAPANVPKGERRAGAGVATGDDAPEKKAVVGPIDGGVAGRGSSMAPAPVLPILLMLIVFLH